MRDGQGSTAPAIADVHRVEQWRPEYGLVEITAEVRQTDAKTGKLLVDAGLRTAERSAYRPLDRQVRAGPGCAGDRCIAEAACPRSRDPWGNARPPRFRFGQARRAASADPPRSPEDVRQALYAFQDRGLRSQGFNQIQAAAPNSGTSRRRPGHHLAWRLHHPGEVPQPHHEAFDASPSWPV